MIKIGDLIPQWEPSSFPDREGKEYEFKMFVPFALSLKQQEIADKEEGSIEGDLQLTALEELLKPQHDFMNKVWIAKNISLPHQNFIYAAIIKKVSDGADAIVTDTARGKKGKKKLFSRWKWWLR